VKPLVWTLRKGADRRVSAHHPWVYSNELSESPKGIDPGALIELRDFAGQFVARGYGNPTSLIAFRVLTRMVDEKNPYSVDWMHSRLERASLVREKLFPWSHRLCHGEADGIPGLIIDRYKTKSHQIFVAQAHTAGAQKLLEFLSPSIERLVGSDFSNTSIVIRNDVSMRKFESLPIEEPRVLKAVKGFDPSQAQILISSAVNPGDAISFSVDLINGQKTGFFLDQASNIAELVDLSRRSMIGASKGPVKILDLFCYVGQWSTQLSRAIGESHTTLVDASAQALELAKKNLGMNCEIVKADAVASLDQFKTSSFDIVICDPPALIKGKKDLPTGQHGYLKLNTNAMRLVKPGGWIVSCSCSGLLEEKDFVSILAKAARRVGREIQWMARGGQSPDHPVRAEFPEGNYLKCWIGRVQSIP